MRYEQCKYINRVIYTSMLMEVLLQVVLLTLCTAALLMVSGWCWVEALLCLLQVQSWCLCTSSLQCLITAVNELIIIYG